MVIAVAVCVACVLGRSAPVAPARVCLAHPRSLFVIVLTALGGLWLVAQVWQWRGHGGAAHRSWVVGSSVYRVSGRGGYLLLLGSVGVPGPGCLVVVVAAAACWFVFSL